MRSVTDIRVSADGFETVDELAWRERGVSQSKKCL